MFWPADVLAVSCHGRLQGCSGPGASVCLLVNGVGVQGMWTEPGWEELCRSGILPGPCLTMKHAQVAKGQCSGKQTTGTACVYTLSQSRSFPLRNPTGSVFITFLPKPVFPLRIGQVPQYSRCPGWTILGSCAHPLPHALQLSNGRTLPADFSQICTFLSTLTTTIPVQACIITSFTPIISWPPFSLTSGCQWFWLLLFSCVYNLNF